MGSECCKCHSEKTAYTANTSLISSTYGYYVGRARNSRRFKPYDRRKESWSAIRERSFEGRASYWAESEDWYGTSRLASVELDAARPEHEVPIFVKRLRDVSAKVGSRARFLAEIESAPPLKVTWYHDNQMLKQNDRLSFLQENKYFFLDVGWTMLQDEGQWTCIAENKHGCGVSSAHLTILVPKAYKAPQFVQELQAVVAEGGAVSLQCKVSGVPTPSLLWYKDGKKIKAGDTFAMRVESTECSSLGTYSCVAKNCLGQAFSSSSLNIQKPNCDTTNDTSTSDSLFPLGPQPKFLRELHNVDAQIESQLTLTCQVVVPPWPKTVDWYNKSGRVIDGEKYTTLADGLGMYGLKIKGVEIVDDGEWKCVATSFFGIKAFSSCFVTVNFPKNYKTPKFLENLRAVMTPEGLVSFECKVIGYPTPQLKWLKDGKELKPGDIYQLTGTNSLGTYCCVAKSPMGEIQSTTVLTLEDIQSHLTEEERLLVFGTNQPPYFVKGLSSNEANINEEFQFNIKVRGKPDPKILWYRNDEYIEENERISTNKESRENYCLRFKYLEMSDQAEWKCVAVNDYGQSVTSCFIKLIIPKHYKSPRFLEKLRATVTEEGTMNLECKVIGVPQPELRWFKDDRRLKSGDIHRIISEAEGKCCLGTYACEAVNCMGTTFSSVSLLAFENENETIRKSLQPDSLSVILEECSSQLNNSSLVSDKSSIYEEAAGISFSFDGKEVSISLYETPDLTEDEALQIVEMYANELTEHISDQNIVTLPPLRFVKEISITGNILMEATLIDVPNNEYGNEEELKTDRDLENSVMDDSAFLTNNSLHSDEISTGKNDLEFSHNIQQKQTIQSYIEDMSEKRTELKNMPKIIIEVESEVQAATETELEKYLLEVNSSEEKCKSVDSEDDSLYEFERRKARNLKENPGGKSCLKISEAESMFITEATTVVDHPKIEQIQANQSVLESIFESINTIEHNLLQIHADVIVKMREDKLPGHIVTLMESLLLPVIEIKKNVAIIEKQYLFKNVESYEVIRELLPTISNPVVELQQSLQRIGSSIVMEKDELFLEISRSILDNVTPPLKHINRELNKIEDLLQSKGTCCSFEELKHPSISISSESLKMIVILEEYLKELTDLALLIRHKICNSKCNQDSQNIGKKLEFIIDRIILVLQWSSNLHRCIELDSEQYSSFHNDLKTFNCCLIHYLDTNICVIRMLLKTKHISSVTSDKLLDETLSLQEKLTTSLKIVESLSPLIAANYLCETLRNYTSDIRENIDKYKTQLSSPLVWNLESIKSMDNSIEKIINSLDTINKCCREENVYHKKRLLLSLTKLQTPLQLYQTHLRIIGKQFSMHNTRLNEVKVYNVMRNVSEPLQMIRKEISLLISNYHYNQGLPDQVCQIIEHLTPTLKNLQDNITTFHEVIFRQKADEIDGLFILSALNDFSSHLYELSSQFLEIEDIILEYTPIVSDPRLGIHIVMRSVSNLVDVVANLQNNSDDHSTKLALCNLSDPLVEVKVCLKTIDNCFYDQNLEKINIKMLKTLSQPFNLLQKRLIEAMEVVNGDLKLAVTNLQRTILTIQDQVSFEYGDQPASIEFNIMTLQTLIQPINVLRKHCLILQDPKNEENIKNLEENIDQVIKEQFENIDQVKIVLAKLTTSQKYLQSQLLLSKSVHSTYYFLNSYRHLILLIKKAILKNELNSTSTNHQIRIILNRLFLDFEEIERSSHALGNVILHLQIVANYLKNMKDISSLQERIELLTSLTPVFKELLDVVNLLAESDLYKEDDMDCFIALLRSLNTIRILQQNVKYHQNSSNTDSIQVPMLLSFLNSCEGLEMKLSDLLFLVENFLDSKAILNPKFYQRAVDAFSTLNSQLFHLNKCLIDQSMSDDDHKEIPFESSINLFHTLYATVDSDYQNPSIKQIQLIIKGILNELTRLKSDILFNMSLIQTEDETSFIDSDTTEKSLNTTNPDLLDVCIQSIRNEFEKCDKYLDKMNKSQFDQKKKYLHNTSNSFECVFNIINFINRNVPFRSNLEYGFIFAMNKPIKHILQKIHYINAVLETDKNGLGSTSDTIPIDESKILVLLADLNESFKYLKELLVSHVGGVSSSGRFINEVESYNEAEREDLIGSFGSESSISDTVDYTTKKEKLEHNLPKIYQNSSTPDQAIFSDETSSLASDIFADKKSQETIFDNNSASKIIDTTNRSKPLKCQDSASLNNDEKSVQDFTHSDENEITIAEHDFSMAQVSSNKLTEIKDFSEQKCEAKQMMEIANSIALSEQNFNNCNKFESVFNQEKIPFINVTNNENKISVIENQLDQEHESIKRELIKSINQNTTLKSPLCINEEIEIITCSKNKSLSDKDCFISPNQITLFSTNLEKNKTGHKIKNESLSVAKTNSETERITSVEEQWQNTEQKSKENVFSPAVHFSNPDKNRQVLEVDKIIHKEIRTEGDGENDFNSKDIKVFPNLEENNILEKQTIFHEVMKIEENVMPDNMIQKEQLERSNIVTAKNKENLQNSEVHKMYTELTENLPSATSEADENDILKNLTCESFSLECLLGVSDTMKVVQKYQSRGDMELTPTDNSCIFHTDEPGRVFIENATEELNEKKYPRFENVALNVVSKTITSKGAEKAEAIESQNIAHSDMVNLKQVNTTGLYKSDQILNRVKEESTSKFYELSFPIEEAEANESTVVSFLEFTNPVITSFTEYESQKRCDKEMCLIDQKVFNFNQEVFEHNSFNSRPTLKEVIGYTAEPINIMGVPKKQLNQQDEKVFTEELTDLSRDNFNKQTNLITHDTLEPQQGLLQQELELKINENKKLCFQELTEFLDKELIQMTEKDPQSVLMKKLHITEQILIKENSSKKKSIEPVSIVVDTDKNVTDEGISALDSVTHNITENIESEKMNTITAQNGNLDTIKVGCDIKIPSESFTEDIAKETINTSLMTIEEGVEMKQVEEAKNSNSVLHIELLTHFPPGMPLSSKPEDSRNDVASVKEVSLGTNNNLKASVTNSDFVQQNIEKKIQQLTKTVELSGNDSLPSENCRITLGIQKDDNYLILKTTEINPELGEAEKIIINVNKEGKATDQESPKLQSQSECYNVNTVTEFQLEKDSINRVQHANLAYIESSENFIRKIEETKRLELDMGIKPLVQCSSEFFSSNERTESPYLSSANDLTISQMPIEADFKSPAEVRICEQREVDVIKDVDSKKEDEIELFEGINILKIDKAMVYSMSSLNDRPLENTSIQSGCEELQKANENIELTIILEKIDGECTRQDFHKKSEKSNENDTDFKCHVEKSNNDEPSINLGDGDFFNEIISWSEELTNFIMKEDQESNNDINVIRTIVSKSENETEELPLEFTNIICSAYKNVGSKYEQYSEASNPFKLTTDYINRDFKKNLSHRNNYMDTEEISCGEVRFEQSTEVLKSKIQENITNNEKSTMLMKKEPKNEEYEQPLKEKSADLANTSNDIEDFCEVFWNSENSYSVLKCPKNQIHQDLECSISESVSEHESFETALDDLESRSYDEVSDYELLSVCNEYVETLESEGNENIEDSVNNFEGTENGIEAVSGPSTNQIPLVESYHEIKYLYTNEFGDNDLIGTIEDSTFLAEVKANEVGSQNPNFSLENKTVTEEFAPNKIIAPSCELEWAQCACIIQRFRANECDQIREPSVVEITPSIISKPEELEKTGNETDHLDKKCIMEKNKNYSSQHISVLPNAEESEEIIIKTDDLVLTTKTNGNIQNKNIQNENTQAELTDRNTWIKDLENICPNQYKNLQQKEIPIDDLKFVRISIVESAYPSSAQSKIEVEAMCEIEKSANKSSNEQISEILVEENCLSADRRNEQGIKIAHNMGQPLFNFDESSQTEQKFLEYPKESISTLDKILEISENENERTYFATITEERQVGFEMINVTADNFTEILDPEAEKFTKRPNKEIIQKQESTEVTQLEFIVSSVIAAEEFKTSGNILNEKQKKVCNTNNVEDTAKISDEIGNDINESLETSIRENEENIFTPKNKENTIKDRNICDMKNCFYFIKEIDSKGISLESNQDNQSNQEKQKTGGTNEEHLCISELFAHKFEDSTKKNIELKSDTGTEENNMLTKIEENKDISICGSQTYLVENSNLKIQTSVFSNHEGNNALTETADITSISYMPVTKYFEKINCTDIANICREKLYFEKEKTPSTINSKLAENLENIKIPRTIKNNEMLRDGSFSNFSENLESCIKTNVENNLDNSLEEIKLNSKVDENIFQGRNINEILRQNNKNIETMEKIESNIIQENEEFMFNEKTLNIEKKEDKVKSDEIEFQGNNIHGSFHIPVSLQDNIYWEPDDIGTTDNSKNKYESPEDTEGQDFDKVSEQSAERLLTKEYRLECLKIPPKSLLVDNINRKSRCKELVEYSPDISTTYSSEASNKNEENPHFKTEEKYKKPVRLKSTNQMVEITQIYKPENKMGKMKEEEGDDQIEEANTEHILQTNQRNKNTNEESKRKFQLKADAGLEKILDITPIDNNDTENKLNVKLEMNLPVTKQLRSTKEVLRTNQINAIENEENESEISKKINSEKLEESTEIARKNYESQKEYIETQIKYDGTEKLKSQQVFEVNTENKRENEIDADSQKNGRRFIKTNRTDAIHNVMNDEILLNKEKLNLYSEKNELQTQINVENDNISDISAERTSSNSEESRDNSSSLTQKTSFQKSKIVASQNVTKIKTKEISASKHNVIKFDTSSSIIRETTPKSETDECVITDISQIENQTHLINTTIEISEENSKLANKWSIMPYSKNRDMHTKNVKDINDPLFVLKEKESENKPITGRLDKSTKRNEIPSQISSADKNYMKNHPKLMRRSEFEKSNRQTPYLVKNNCQDKVPKWTTDIWSVTSKSTPALEYYFVDGGVWPTTSRLILESATTFRPFSRFVKSYRPMMTVTEVHQPKIFNREGDGPNLLSYYRSTNHCISSSNNGHATQVVVNSTTCRLNALFERIYHEYRLGMTANEFLTRYGQKASSTRAKISLNCQRFESGRNSKNKPRCLINSTVSNKPGSCCNISLCGSTNNLDFVLGLYRSKWNVQSSAVTNYANDIRYFHRTQLPRCYSVLMCTRSVADFKLYNPSHKYYKYNVKNEYSENIPHFPLRLYSGRRILLKSDREKRISRYRGASRKSNIVTEYTLIERYPSSFGLTNSSSPFYDSLFCDLNPHRSRFFQRYYYFYCGLSPRVKVFYNTDKELLEAAITLHIGVEGTKANVERMRSGRGVPAGNNRWSSDRFERYTEQSEQSERLGLRTLAVADVGYGRAGEYGGGSNAKATATARAAGKPPMFVSRPATSVRVNADSDVSVSFRVSGEPKPRVRWTRGLADMTMTGRALKETVNDYTRLTLKRARATDAATYFVTAENKYGSDRAFFTLRVNQPSGSLTPLLLSSYEYYTNSNEKRANIRANKVPSAISSEPFVSDSAKNRLTLTWSKPTPTTAVASPVLLYRVEASIIDQDEDAKWTELGSTPTTSVDLYDIIPGRYNFRVTPRNWYGWGESKTTSNPVTVAENPKFPEFEIYLPGQLNALRGSTVQLECKVKNDESAIIRWFLNGALLQEDEYREFKFKEGRCLLRLINLRDVDSGRYVCEASNSQGTICTFTRLSVVQDAKLVQACHRLNRLRRENQGKIDMAPQFTMRLRDKRVDICHPIRLTCQVLGYPKPTVAWYRSGQLVKENQNYSIYREANDFYSLEMSKATAECAGTYSAVASNPSGTVSCKCELTVDKGVPSYEIPKFIDQLAQVYAVSENSQLRIRAKVHAYPAVRITWKKNGVGLRPSRRIIATVSHGGEVELTIAQMNRADSGVYTCTAANIIGQADTNTRIEVCPQDGRSRRESAAQNAHSSNPIPGIPKEPRFLVKPRSCEAIEDDHVVIECKIVGVPKPKIIWLRNRLKLDYYRDYDEFKVSFCDSDPFLYRLEIPRVKFDHTGAYTIVAQNDVGEAKAVVSLQVYAKGAKKNGMTSEKTKHSLVEKTPKIKRHLADIQCSDGDSVTFEFEVDTEGDSSELNFHWYKNGKLIPLGEDFEWSVRGSAASFAIGQVYAEDEGQYSCVVSNNLGTATTTACLIVNVPEEKKNIIDRGMKGRPSSVPFSSLTPLTCHPTTFPAENRRAETENGEQCDRVAPKFEWLPGNKVAQVGDTVRFECSARGWPRPSSSWHKDDVRLSSTGRILVEERNDVRTLQIAEVSREDEGLYRVVLENEHGRVAATVRLDVIGPRARPRNSIASLTYARHPICKVANANSDCTISCNAPNGTANSSAAWYKNGEAVRGKEKAVSKRSDLAFRLLLKNLSGSDCGVYTCILETDGGKTRCSAELVVLEKDDRDMVDLRPPVFLNGLPPKSVVCEGASFQFRVKLEGNLPMCIAWFKNDRRLPQCDDFQYADLGAGEFSLTLSDAFLADGGWYRCEARNGHGDAVSVGRLVVSDASGWRRNTGGQQESTRFADEDEEEEEEDDGQLDDTEWPGRSRIMEMSGRRASSESRIGDRDPQSSTSNRMSISSNDCHTKLEINAATVDHPANCQATAPNGGGADTHCLSRALQGRPDPPTGEPNSVAGERSATVTWCGPAYDGGSKITGYTVEMRSYSNHQWRTVIENCHSLFCTVRALQPGEFYVFRVRAENMHGLSEPSVESVATYITHADVSSPLEKKKVSVRNGKLFADEYEVLEELGKGRYGVVRKTRHKELGNAYAAKFVRCIKSTDKDKVREEVAIMNTLKHPKLLQLVAAYENPKEMIVVTEYISGGELFERVVADDFTLTERDCILFTRQICEGVAYIHKNNIVHLDLKPENIMCVSRTSHQIKLIDFGLAQKISPDAPVRVLFGTPEFIPPEIINYEPIGTESDMWSVGVVCYVLLSGLSPFMGENDAETFANITRADFDFDDEAFEAISKDAKDFISSLLIKRRRERLTAKQCLHHKWLAQHDKTMSCAKLCTDKLKKFIIRRKWQKTGNAIRALGRMATLSAASRRNSSTNSSPCSSPRLSLSGTYSSRMSSLGLGEDDSALPEEQRSARRIGNCDRNSEGTRPRNEPNSPSLGPNSVGLPVSMSFPKAAQKSVAFDEANVSDPDVGVGVDCSEINSRLRDAAHATNEEQQDVRASPPYVGLLGPSPSLSSAFCDKLHVENDTRRSKLSSSHSTRSLPSNAIGQPVCTITSRPRPNDECCETRRDKLALAGPHHPSPRSTSTPTPSNAESDSLFNEQSDGVSERVAPGNRLTFSHDTSIAGAKSTKDLRESSSAIGSLLDCPSVVFKNTPSPNCAASKTESGMKNKPILNLNPKLSEKTNIPRILSDAAEIKTSERLKKFQRLSSPNDIISSNCAPKMKKETFASNKSNFQKAVAFWNRE